MTITFCIVQLKSTSIGFYMKHKWFAIIIFCLCWSAAGLAPEAVYGAVKITVRSTDGGSRLQFGRVDIPSAVNKEVQVRITSSDAQQYQVFQRLNAPLTNEKGEILQRDVIVASSLIDSNAAGSLYMQNGQTLTATDQIIYTSSPDGQSDMFTLIYEVDPEKMRMQGNFSGEILYTVRNVTNGADDRAYMDVYLDAATAFDYTAEISSGLDTLKLRAIQEAETPAYFSFAFENNLGDLKVYQEVVTVPVNQEQEPLDLETIVLSTDGGEYGDLAFQDETAMPRDRILIYASTEKSDAFYVYYHLDPEAAKRPKAGIYTGTVRYTIAHNGIEEVVDYALQVEIEPYFNIDLTYPEDGMAFTDLLPTGEPRTKQIIARVESNMFRPYMVTQKVTPGGLRNEEGDQVEESYFRVSEELIEESTGKVAHTDFTPVQEGETTLFHSDKQGSPATFKVYYQLQPYPAMEAGNYTTGIVFSLEEL